MLGLDPELLRHGVAREIYVMPLAFDCRDFLCGVVEDVHVDLPKAHEIASAALERWVLPRAARRPEYKEFDRSMILTKLRPV
jgi:hypothetical protein